jgi:hypothetical protein
MRRIIDDKGNGDDHNNTNNKSCMWFKQQG